MKPIDQAIVLVGGFGTRLGTHTKTTPKPLIDVAGRPFAEYVLNAVAATGVRDVILLAGYLGEKISQLYDGQCFGDAHVRVVVEPVPLGTAGGLRYLAEELHDQFYVLNGDTYFDFDLNRLSRPLFVGAKTGVLALRSVSDTRRYGRALLQAGQYSDDVTAFLEKDDTSTGGLVNAGIYAFKRDVLRYISFGNVNMEQTVLPALAAERKLGAVTGTGYFIDIGIPESLEIARAELPFALHRPAVFFDRDGTLNIDHGYTHRQDDLQLVDGAIEAVKRCNEAGHYVFVVTNQAGVAHGYYDEETVRSFHRAMQSEFRLNGAHIDRFYFCPHHPEGSVDRYRQVCSCRKPAPGLIRQALAEWSIDRERSLLIGDKGSDIEAAAACNIRGLRFGGGNLQIFLEEHGVLANRQPIAEISSATANH